MKKLGYAAWFVAWFIIFSFILVPLKPVVSNYGAAYGGPAGAAIAVGVFTTFWLALLFSGMAVIRALFDHPRKNGGSATLVERLLDLATWQKGIAGVACGLFAAALIIILRVSVDPEFATWYQALSTRNTPSSAIPSGSQAFDPSSTIHSDKVIVDSAPPTSTQAFDPGMAKPLTPDELNAVGLQYLTGQVSESDEKQRYLSALYFLTQAAEAGSIIGQHNLGIAYSLEGGGLGGDNVQAMKWLIIAKANGSSGSNEFLNDVAARSTSEQIAKANAMAKEWLSIQH